MDNSLEKDNLLKQYKRREYKEEKKPHNIQLLQKIVTQVTPGRIKHTQA